MVNKSNMQFSTQLGKDRNRVLPTLFIVALHEMRDVDACLISMELLKFKLISLIVKP